MKILGKLLKTVIILGVIFGVLIGLPLALFHFKSEAPIEDYTDASESGFFTTLNTELETLITDENEQTVALTVSDAFINRMIQKQLSSGNPKYQVSEFEGQPEYDYMMVVGNIIGLKGAWTTLTDDSLTITVGADVLLGGKRFYQTGLEMAFDIVLSENDEYFLEVSRIQIGAMKLPKKAAFDFASSIVKTMTSKSLNDMIAEQLSFAEFNEEEISFTVNEAGLTDYLYGIEPSFAALLKIVYQESLLILDISNLGFDIQLTIGSFRRLPSDLDEPTFTKWESEADKAAFMVNFSADAAANALLHPTDPYIDLSEADVNSILDYTLSDKIKFEFPIEFMLNGVQVEYTFESTNLYVHLDNTVLSTHFRMTLSKVGMAGAFEMQFNLSTNVSMNDAGDMILTIIESNIGTVNLDQERLAMIFGVLDPTLMVGNTLVIPAEKVNEMFEGSGIVINNSYVTGSQLRLHYGLASA